MQSLAIGFGSRGRSGASAHYEPARKVINLTKMKGAGSLAHEIGHAFDHYLYNLCGFEGSAGECFLSQVMSDYGRRYCERDSEAASDIASKMYNLVAAFKKDENTNYTTSYYKSAIELDRGRSKPYYALIIEMFARAFESYVEDRLAENGMVSQYLVHSTRSNSIYGSHKPYPEGAERAKFNQLIHDLITTVKKYAGDTGFKVGNIYLDKDAYISYKDSVVLTDKKTKKQIGKVSQKRFYNTVDDFAKAIKTINKSLEIDNVNTGESPIDKMNYWTDGAQLKGLLGRIGFAKLPSQGQGISGVIFKDADKIIIDSTASDKKKLEGIIEATMMSAASHSSVKHTQQVDLLAKTAAIIVLQKEGYDTKEYFNDDRYLELIQNNALVKQHLSMAYDLVNTLVH